ncbi:hypothetical protein [Paucibacter soli]|uniref:hypothetical protein n=1 Tax=Paucibacter soli TaxID=3133433 RepID=UPI0030B2993D
MTDISTPERRTWRRDRIAELRAELGALLDEEAQDGSPKVDLAALREECRKLKAIGDYMPAIKLYRARTGLSLIEAREVIDGLG